MAKVEFVAKRAYINHEKIIALKHENPRRLCEIETKNKIFQPSQYLELKKKKTYT